MHDWDPALYQRFESERTRPAVELLAIDIPEDFLRFRPGRTAHQPPYLMAAGAQQGGQRLTDDAAGPGDQDTPGKC